MCSLCVSGSCCYPPSSAWHCRIWATVNTLKPHTLGWVCVREFRWVPAREREGGRGMCASGRVDYNCHAPVSDCLHLKMRRPSPPYPLYLPFSTFLCSCFSCCISFLMLTTCHIMQLHCHVAAAVELSFRCFSSASAASTKTCCFCYCCCCCCSCSCCCG